MNGEIKRPELVVFDIDGTLMSDSPDHNTGRAFWRLNELGILATEATKLAELSEARQQLIDNPEPDPLQLADYAEQIVEEFDTHIGGLPRRAVARVFEEQADYLASEGIYPELTEEIDYWRDRGATLAIISGSPDLFVRALKRRLNFDMSTGTRHFFQQGAFHTSRSAIARASEKHLIAHKMCERIGNQAVFAAAYGDSMGDFSMLEHTEYPVAVNPKPALREHAIERDWTIIETANSTMRVA